MYYNEAVGLKQTYTDENSREKKATKEGNLQERGKMEIKGKDNVERRRVIMGG